MRTQAILQRWGNCIALRISGNLRTIPGFSAGETVAVEVSDKGLIIQKMPKARPTEASLLEGLSAYTAHADEMAAPGNRETEY
ncbi:AbrB/MazE/SpoVT family DNA-binding domain-containing protein [Pantoea stewartii]|uniref:Transcriptional regulator n=1 Tax=Pantoea stewartii subsp. stewartii DC283 TaxID=660596 RepID=A0ABM6KB44_PANSE|nr:cell growth regulatory protein MazE [Pantoea stewartii]ARF51483.1 transcriptional regulator [Pantoea stewartii subsp. stewartii DC283]KAB0559723.1 transcriptional regulator [Pantoea stewartii subsp. stewartii]